MKTWHKLIIVIMLIALLLFFFTSMIVGAIIPKLKGDAETQSRIKSAAIAIILIVIAILIIVFLAPVSLLWGWIAALTAIATSIWFLAQAFKPKKQLIDGSMGRGIAISTGKPSYIKPASQAKFQTYEAN